MGRKKSGGILRVVDHSPREAGDTTGGSEHGSSFFLDLEKKKISQVRRRLVRIEQTGVAKYLIPVSSPTNFSGFPRLQVVLPYSIKI